MAQDTWNTSNPELVAQAYTPDSRWRNQYRVLQVDSYYTVS